MSACPAAAPSGCLSRKSANREARNACSGQCRASARRPVIVVTDVANGEQRLVKAKDIAADPLRTDLAKQLRMGKERHDRGRRQEVVSPMFMRPTAKSSSSARFISARPWRRCALAGYDVTVVDPRTAFASPERFPDVPLIAEWPDVALPPLNVDHSPPSCADARPRSTTRRCCTAFRCDCFYIGGAGPRKTHAKRAERLKAQGATDADIARIHAPIGLTDRRGLAVRDRGRNHGRDHRAAAGCRKKPRHEIRSRQVRRTRSAASPFTPCVRDYWC